MKGLEDFGFTEEQKEYIKYTAVEFGLYHLPQLS